MRVVDIYLQSDRIYWRVDSLVYSAWINYTIVMQDPRSWSYIWLQHFGKHGPIRYEWKFYKLIPMPQPNQSEWIIPLVQGSIDIDATVNFARHKVSGRVDKIFKKDWSLVDEKNKPFYEWRNSSIEELS